MMAGPLGSAIVGDSRGLGRWREPFVFAAMAVVFVLAWFLPFGSLAADGRTTGALRESLLMVQDYAHHHVLLCLVPALFIAGAVAAFVSQAAVMRYFGAGANKAVAYGVASVSGAILAACSCTILPLFAGIRRRGAGLGPAVAFLYSGPAINVLAIVLTARVLGWELGLARAVGAVFFAVVLGVTMHAIYRREERERAEAGGLVLPDDVATRRPWQDAVHFAALVAVLVFANWTKVSEEGLAAAVFEMKWWLAGTSLLVVVWASSRWLAPGELREWMGATWGFTKQILPLLLAGVLVAGFLLGRPGHPALVPAEWVERAVGGNGAAANLFASIAGAFMYIATLTEVPILEGLLGAGMGKGPALALLLAGPALSLPNMLVIRSVLGTRKTLVYVSLVVVFSTIAGMVYGAAWGGA